MTESAINNKADATPRVAIVTGGSRGIGRAVTERLAQQGPVVVGYRSNATEAESVVAAIREHGGQAIAVAADVAEEAQVTNLFDIAEEQFGGVDVVANAAGLMILGPLVDFELADLDRVHRTNIRGAFVVSQQAARRLRPGGALVNFSSSVLGRNLPGYTAYAASKGAVEAMTFILAQEMRGRDISVNAVAPGPTATDMFLNGKTDEQLASSAAAAPLGRLGEPSDIADVVAFLASPAGHWINGQTVRANGGLI